MRIVECEEREQHQKRMFDRLIEAFENNDKDNSHDNQRLIDEANAHLNNPLLFTPSCRSLLQTPSKEIDRMQEQHDREVEELKQRLSRAESQLEKSNLKVQQLKLKRQTIQGDLDQSQQQKESQNAQLQQYKSLIQSLEAKNAELVDLLNTNKTKWN